SGGANRSRRRLRAASPAPPYSSTSPTGGALGRRVVTPALLVSRRVSRFGRQARTTVSPGETRHGLKHLLPSTPRASRTPPPRPPHATPGSPPSSPRRHGGRSSRPP